MINTGCVLFIITKFSCLLVDFNESLLLDRSYKSMSKAFYSSKPTKTIGKKFQRIPKLPIFIFPVHKVSQIIENGILNIHKTH